MEVGVGICPYLHELKMIQSFFVFKVPNVINDPVCSVSLAPPGVLAGRGHRAPAPILVLTVWVSAAILHAGLLHCSRPACPFSRGCGQGERSRYLHRIPKCYFFICNFCSCHLPLVTSAQSSTPAMCVGNRNKRPESSRAHQVWALLT